MNGSAPNWLAEGFQVLEKILTPSVENHEAACWLVETAIRTRITSTSRPAASAMAWKLMSPNGGRPEKGGADPAGPAGSAFVAVLTVASRSDQWAPWCSPQSGGDLAELRLGHLVDAGRQRRVAQRGEQLLARPEQVADVRLEHLGVVRSLLLCEDQVPRLVGDRVSGGVARPDRGERQVRRDLGPGRGRGRRRRRGRDVLAGRVLDTREGQPRRLGVGVVAGTDGPGRGLDDLRQPAVAVAAPAAGRPVNGRAAAKLPCLRGV